MDDNLRRQMQEAFRENDRLVAEDDAFQRRYQNYLKQRSGGEQLIYKTVPAERQPQRQMTSAEMDRKIAAALHQFKKDLTAAVGYALGSIRAEWQEEIRKALADFQPQLPSIEGWQPRHYLKGSVVVSGGGTYQARQDTAHPPGHHTWVCLAAPGARMDDGAYYLLSDSGGETAGVRWCWNTAEIGAE